MYKDPYDDGEIDPEEDEFERTMRRIREAAERQAEEAKRRKEKKVYLPRKPKAPTNFVEIERQLATNDYGVPEKKPDPYILLSRTPLPPTRICSKCDGCGMFLAEISYSGVGGGPYEEYCKMCDEGILKILIIDEQLEIIDVDYTTSVV